MPPLEGAREAMREITGAVLASSLVLLAVFVPVAFFPGTTGQLYKQFALTIACSITISLFCALTLTPVLSSLLLGAACSARARFFRPVNRAIDATRSGYRRAAAAHHAPPRARAGVFARRARRDGLAFTHIADRLRPRRGPGLRDRHRCRRREGVSLDYTHRVQRDIEAILTQQPEVSDVFDVAGFSFTRHGHQQGDDVHPAASRGASAGSRRTRSTRCSGASTSGCSGLIPERRCSRSIRRRSRGSASRAASRSSSRTAPTRASGRCSARPTRSSVRPTRRPAGCSASTRRSATTSRPIRSTSTATRRCSLGVPLANIFNTMQVYLGSVYVNDFDLNGKSYRVYVQADTPYRSRIADLSYDLRPRQRR